MLLRMGRGVGGGGVAGGRSGGRRKVRMHGGRGRWGTRGSMRGCVGRSSWWSFAWILKMVGGGCGGGGEGRRGCCMAAAV